MSELHKTVNRFSQFAYSQVGNGPDHPTNPDKSISNRIDQFLENNKFLLIDETYVEFLKCYSAAAILLPDLKFMVHIFGFSPEITMEVDRPDESLHEKNGIFRIAEMLIQRGPRMVHDTLGYNVGYDYRASGVYIKSIPQGTPYAKMPEIPYVRHYDSFLQWLKQLVDEGSDFSL